ncbi:MlaD family protein [Vibrio natriegens]|uniref:Glycerophosphodiester phosphodiesterase n=1 Tax=Vibrio natriegens NBRC 15636 = ATCC 14048 = DSM 759 TaxID=1219067 RepID=A0AAN0Y669_VIBNA|nr:MlaD family protein [Vibrio natriegens]ALR18564.1 glycerophosphodiester phosphodiesterase [Vibrio natriegens NBRC 15636 = ATCC 14048 = DSM 759]ANQ14529.1 glycerophosphodiester phosphodiesterase [Vibrio natriegens NBRC 15636 = ATCC 14048 = DSM 759]EPM39561.1 glycerophosphoryl diester phosphodiesterase [Vibrio natriegens NBRC 15636 = ATCC 14048 = DSM 759]MDX6028513.1 MlaD family protein [Vibrio natriegens NBRC 15636 = ATCC 14048 = DSM 759]UUI14758.1 MlaD family protein [Vibrio natriegens]
MDDSKGSYKLGLFVVSALISLFVVLFILEGRSLFEPKMIVETYFDESVSGLDVGAPVRFRGITAGEVVSIELSDAIYESDVPRENRRSYVVVRSEITGAKKTVAEWDMSVQVAIDRGLRATTQLAGITGQQFLSFDFISTEKGLSFDWTPEYPYVPSTKSSTGKIVSGIQNLIDRLDEADINTLVSNINMLIETLDGSIGQIDVESLNVQLIELLKNTNQMVKSVDGVVSDAEIKAIMSSVAQISKKLNTTLNNGGELNQLINDLDRAAVRLDVIMADNQSDINYVIKDLRVTVENLKDFSETLKSQPSSIIFSAEPEKLKLD